MLKEFIVSLLLLEISTSFRANKDSVKITLHKTPYHIAVDIPLPMFELNDYATKSILEEARAKLMDMVNNDHLPPIE